LTKSSNVVSFLVDSILAKTSDLKKVRNAVREQAFPFIILMENKTDQDRFVKEIHDKTGISETALWEDLKLAETQKSPVAVRELSERSEFSSNATGAFRSATNASFSASNRALGILALKAEKGDAAVLVEKLKAASPDDFARFETMSADEKNDLAFEAEVLYDVKDLEKNFDELVLHIEEGRLASMLEEKFAEVYKAEKEKDVGKAKELLKECGEISKRLNEIKQNLRK